MEDPVVTGIFCMINEQKGFSPYLTFFWLYCQAVKTSLYTF
jgi:hypothetical protein